jgi:hypothetical protein
VTHIQVDEVIARLAKLGFKLNATVSDPNSGWRDIEPTAMLQPATYRFSKANSTGGLHFQLGVSHNNQPRLAFLTAHDRSDDKFHDVALHLIVILDELMPGVTYKRSDSALTPDPVDNLRALLRS